MRKELYAVLKAAMEKIEAVKHVDLWNHNVEFIEQEDSWARPAVFVEFGPIAWQPYVGGGYRGEGSVRLHVVTDWLEGGQEAAWTLIAKFAQPWTAWRAISSTACVSQKPLPTTITRIFLRVSRCMA